MALTHLLDASVVRRFASPSVRASIDALWERGDLARAGITDLEICSSARTLAEWEQWQAWLEAFTLIETVGRHLARARQVQRVLAMRGQRGHEVPDLLVAAAGEEAKIIVLHYDSDFDRISEVTGQRCEWVVPPGTVD